MTERSNTESDLSVEDKKKPSSQELKNDMTEELVQELEKMLIVTPVLISTEVVENTQRLSKKRHPLDERENSRKHTFGSNELDKEKINEVVKDRKWKLKIETHNEGSLNNARETTKNVRSSSNQAVIEKL
ncbi:10256_t:CDS:2, partial [Dentiscutata heterogama]